MNHLFDVLVILEESKRNNCDLELIENCLEVVAELSITLEIMLSIHDNIFHGLPSQEFFNKLPKNLRETYNKNTGKLSLLFAKLLKTNYWDWQNCSEFVNYFSILSEEILIRNCYINSNFTESIFDYYLPFIRKTLNFENTYNYRIEKLQFNLGTSFFNIIKILLNKFIFTKNKSKEFIMVNRNNNNTYNLDNSIIMNELAICINKLEIYDLFIDFFRIYIDEALFLNQSSYSNIDNSTGFLNKMLAQKIVVENYKIFKDIPALKPNYETYTLSLHNYMKGVLETFNLSLEILLQSTNNQISKNSHKPFSKK